MTQKKDNNRKYKSLFNNESCGAAQYIAELVCKRRSEKENKGSLSYKFWNTGPQKVMYQTQVRAANKVIKKYGEDAVLHYLRNKGWNVYSLGFLHKSKKFVLILDFVKDGLEEAKVLVEKEAKREKKVIEMPTGDRKLRKPRSKNSLLSKLRNIDGKKEQ